MSHPVYRILVNKDLIVERTYGWPAEQYVQEKLIVNVLPGQHILLVENPGSNFLANFKLRNFKVNGIPGIISGSQCVFTVDESFPAAA
jgi:hypothetical protein